MKLLIEGLLGVNYFLPVFVEIKLPFALIVVANINFQAISGIFVNDAASDYVILPTKKYRLIRVAPE